MHRDRIWTLMSRKLSGEATEAELSELDNLVNSHPDMDIPVQFINEFWHIPSETEEEFLEATFHLHSQRLKEKGYDLELEKDEAGSLNLVPERNKTVKRLVWAVAAVVVTVIAVFVGQSYNKVSNTAPEKTAQAEVSTKNGSRSKITLPDGTQVWLNSDSKLIYDNENFGLTNREVTLTGEAYFDVVKNPARPFIIHTRKINIKVVGTAFNVKAYPEDKQTETSLIRGSIEVTIKNRPNDKIMLSPNEKLIVENNDIINRKTKAVVADGRNEFVADTVPPLVSVNKITYNPEDSTVVETAWVNNHLVFRDEAFEDVAVRMERWFNSEIEIQGEALRKKRINVTFANETITQALDALKLSFAFKYRQEGTKIIIYH